MKIVKSLEESRLLIKGISKTIKNEAKEQKGGFINCWYIKKCISRKKSNKSGSKFLMLPHPSTNFEIQKSTKEPTILANIYETNFSVSVK